MAVEEILTSALFWELSRFRSRLTTHVESTLKSGDQRIQAHTLTLLLRFPRGSYTSKFVRNLAIDTAIALESVAEKVSTYITLRRLLLALIGDNAKVGAKVCTSCRLQGLPNLIRRNRTRSMQCI